MSSSQAVATHEMQHARNIDAWGTQAGVTRHGRAYRLQVNRLNLDIAMVLPGLQETDERLQLIVLSRVHIVDVVS